MKILNSKNKNFDKNLDYLLFKRRTSIKSDKVSVTNIISDVKKNGDKNIYIRVTAPNKKILQSSEPIKIQNYNGDNIEVSSKRVVNYQNENMDLCIYHDIVGSIETGSYLVEIYNDGYIIGNSSFALR